MSHHDHHAADAAGESVLDLLARFFPGQSEFSAFVGGVVLGTVILGALAALGLLVGGHLGIWRTF